MQLVSGEKLRSPVAGSSVASISMFARVLRRAILRPFGAATCPILAMHVYISAVTTAAAAAATGTGNDDRLPQMSSDL